VNQHQEVISSGPKQKNVFCSFYRKIQSLD
jgi:hypothetical protein